MLSLAISTRIFIEYVIPPVAINPQTFGCVDGVRIDSLKAEYATFQWGAEKLFFHYGQSETRKKTIVTNEKGEVLVFPRQSISFALNFLYFNGWELKQASNMDVFILKKRHDPYVYSNLGNM